MEPIGCCLFFCWKGVVQKTAEYFSYYSSNSLHLFTWKYVLKVVLHKENVKYVSNVSSEHAWITDNYGTAALFRYSSIDFVLIRMLLVQATIATSLVLRGSIIATLMPLDRFFSSFMANFHQGKLLQHQM